MPRNVQYRNRGHYGGYGGTTGFGFEGFGVPFLGGLAGGLLGNALFPGYGGGFGSYGGYGRGYGNVPWYGGGYPMPYYPYGYMPYPYYGGFY